MSQTKAVHTPDPGLIPDTHTYGIMLAIWGGLVHFVGREHHGKTWWRLILILIADLVTAGFVAQLTWHLALAAGIDPEVSVALCGIGGHMGSRALALLERIYTRSLGGRGE